MKLSSPASKLLRKIGDEILLKSLAKNGDNENISCETICLAATHVAAVSLFWNTNMAATISCENARTDYLTERYSWIKILSVKDCLSQNLLFLIIFCNTGVDFFVLPSMQNNVS